ncbi:evolutionarily conserved C-terminal region 5 [Abeliophyllum distichum]|uniref:YTH domain-containing family protein n=1 Tax=Abeliophyllum distichum TaxID=126358 RepID=A0ABD1VCX4_9LAMI
MEDARQQSLDGFASVPSPGDRAADLHNLAEQPLSPKDERVVSANPSPDTAISRAPENSKDQPATSETSGALSTMYPFNAYTLQEQGIYYGGYDNGTGNWDEHSNYVSVNNLHVIPPAMYNDNPPLFFPTGYGFDSQMAYGQFSPLPSPLSPIMFDGQLYSPHQMPVSSPYYPPPVSPGLPHVTSAFPVSQSELMPSEISGQENPMDNALFGPGSGFYVPFGAFGGGDISGSSGVGLYKFPGDFGSSESLPNHSSTLDTGKFMSPLAAGTVYPQSIGILGSYEQNVAQTSFQGYGLTPNSSARRYPHAGSYQRGFTSNRNQFSIGKGGRREKERDSVSVSTDTLGISSDRNRGPRSSKAMSKSLPGEGTSSGVHKDVESTSGFDISQFNAPDFTTDYENANFFVIKSFSEDNIHRSIKYNVWASTSLGNRKLDAAYREAKEINGICPVFLFFSVNASGQFCGVAEMVGPVDFDNDAEYWQQDRWSGQFPVKWHIIKDVPNSSFRHILLENNENKPVTHSRDSQEVKLEQGIEMLKIFKNHNAETSLLDDFTYYDEREKSLLERKVKQRATLTGNTAAALTAADSINQLSDNLADTLRLDSGKSLPKTEFE